MDKLIIDPEFRDKIPPLTEDEFSLLEENILSDGAVFSPIVVWNDVILDGHNRYEIIQKHPELTYAIHKMPFANRYEAISWICRHQLGRRNLTPQQKKYHQPESHADSDADTQVERVKAGQGVTPCRSHRAAKADDFCA